MRSAFGIVLYVVAGFFVYMVCMLAFMNLPAIPKWRMVAGFTIPAVLSHCGGLAVDGFRNWRWHTGIVLVTAAGFVCWLIFTIICAMMEDEFRQLIRPETLNFFNAYGSGGMFVAITGSLGMLLLATGKDPAEPSAGGDAEDRAPQP